MSATKPIPSVREKLEQGKTAASVLTNPFPTMPAASDDQQEKPDKATRADETDNNDGNKEKNDKPKSTTGTSKKTATNQQNPLEQFRKVRFIDQHTSRSFYYENELLKQFDAFCEEYKLDKSKVMNEGMRMILEHYKGYAKS